MKNQTIGVELEFTGLTRLAAAEVVAGHFGTAAELVNDYWARVTDNEGRIWKVVSDSSIAVNGGEDCELVTPILRWADIETLQEIVRKLRKAGATVNRSCGCHVHIGAAGMTAQAVRNLVNNVASHEELLYKALAVHESRKRYCRPTNERFLWELNRAKPATLEELGEIWYGRPADDFPTIHYHESRYHTLNLHALFTKGTVEFRIFNSSLHAGEVKTAMQLSCALVAMAKQAIRTPYRPLKAENEKAAMNTWLTRYKGLNLNGEEFRTARHHLTKNLSNGAALRHAV